MPKQKEREQQKNIDLSRLEKVFLVGLQAREREIQKDWIAPLQEDYAAFINEIQANHGVVLGQDYTLNQVTGVLVPIVKEEKKSKLELVKDPDPED